MISDNDFVNIVENLLNIDLTQRNTRNREQRESVLSPMNQSLYIVAGPGSGKTTTMTLRVLKLIFVDDVSPSQILVTTFTKKAADELRSRILGWGDIIRRYIITNYPQIGEQARELDINQIITGTLDSIIEDVLTEFRPPGAPPPVVIEDFVSQGIMINVLLRNGYFRNKDLKDYVIYLKGSSYGVELREISSTLLDIKDRIYHDGINIHALRQNVSQSGLSIALDAIENYINVLTGDPDRRIFDFALLEDEFLQRLRNGELNQFANQIRFVMVDEYQDTNYLQEQIYFELARHAISSGGSIAVVGDDDQSLYRFRGATVDLFLNFPQRIQNQLNITPRTIYLSLNYRSTNNIVSFCNEFIHMDRSYEEIRPRRKPDIIRARNTNFDNYPILGMFRDTLDELAEDLAQFIYDVVYGGGRIIYDNDGNEYEIRVDINEGSLTDIVFLSSSPSEFNSLGNPRLPRLLRERLENLEPPVRVFNPRGQNLASIPQVQILCGLILECIDPDSTVQNGTPAFYYRHSQNEPSIADIFDNWRDRANQYINGIGSQELRTFVDTWRRRGTLNRRGRLPYSVPLVKLVYDLITWIPFFQEDVEGLVYLEAINRAITQSALYSDYKSEIIYSFQNRRRAEASIREALWHIFVPIATNAIDINEDLLETVPRHNRLSIMSIHQAKGLEYPLVIVDVGSDFRTNHWRQAFKRFPQYTNDNRRVRDLKSVNMETELRPYSPLGAPNRSPVDRSFDDLIRHYFVAYSRPMDALLLVGLNSVRNGYHTSSGRERTIPNVATGWDRNENWIWGRGLPNLIHI